MSQNSLDLAQKLLKCPSVTPMHAGTLDILQQELEALGFAVFRKVFHSGNYAVENLYASYKSNNEVQDNLCFAGHVDVVPVGDEASWKHPPFSATIEDGKLYSRGACDMKIAIACWVNALKQVNLEQLPKGKKLSLLITADEEADSIDGTKPMLEYIYNELGEKITACIIGEPTSREYIGENIKVGSRGSLNFKVKIKGKQGHVAYQEFAKNPLENALHAAWQLQTADFNDGDQIFPPTNIEITSFNVDNKATNIIPEVAIFAGNARYNNKQKVEDMLKNIAGDIEILPGSQYYVSQDQELIEMVQKSVQKIVGKKPNITGNGGTSDGRFIYKYCPVVEFGFNNFTAHQVDEFVELKEIEQIDSIYKDILEQYIAE